jgi:hypothetical protein
MELKQEMPVEVKTEQEQWTEDLMPLYRERARIAANTFREKYEAMHNSNVAFHQKIPKDIINAASRQNSDSNANKFLMPWLAIIVKQLKKEMTVNMPSFNLKGNNEAGKQVVDEFNRSLAEIFSYQNFGFKMKFAYDFGGIKGTIVEETVFEKMTEEYFDVNGEIKKDVLGGAVDFMFYDPMLVLPDPDASPMDFQGTAKWCIVTKGFYSSDCIEEQYGIKVQGKASGSGYIADQDLDKFDEMNLSGVDPVAANLVTVRYYYLTDGYVYTVVADTYVVERRMNFTRTVGKIPINFAPLVPDPDCVFGLTFWEIIRWCVAMASKAMNQIADNNEFNNEFPIAVLRGANLELMQQGSDNDGVKFLEINPLGERSSIQDIVHKFHFPEVTNGATFMLEVANQMINLLTGISPASMGVQAKQMRTTAEANIYQQAILTNSSEVVINVETSLINPMVWDVLRIFSRHPGEFKFEHVDSGFLKNFKNVHVANGSMLEQDRIKRQDFLAYLLQRAQMNPMIFDQMKIEEFGLRTFGEPNPQSWLRTPEQVAQQQAAMQKEAMMRAAAPAGGQGG